MRGGEQIAAALSSKDLDKIDRRADPVTQIAGALVAATVPVDSQLQIIPHMTPAIEKNGVFRNSGFAFECQHADAASPHQTRIPIPYPMQGAPAPTVALAMFVDVQHETKQGRLDGFSLFWTEYIPQPIVAESQGPHIKRPGIVESLVDFRSFDGQGFSHGGQHGGGSLPETPVARESIGGRHAFHGRDGPVEVSLEAGAACVTRRLLLPGKFQNAGQGMMGIQLVEVALGQIQQMLIRLGNLGKAFDPSLNAGSRRSRQQQARMNS